MMAKSAPRRLVVCDLDDTLYLERDYVMSGLAAVGAWANTQLGVAGLGDAMITRFRSGSRGHVFDETLAAMGIDGAPALIGRMLQVYRQHRPSIALAADARRFLGSMPPDTAVALVTDGFLDAQRRKIRALGLHALGVSLAICTDRWGREAWKPSPRAFSYVQSHFGIPADACIYIGDNANKDFHAPRTLGWRTMQIVRPGGLHGLAGPGAQAADVRIGTLDDAKCLLLRRS
jgi:putative hydrolase of the HAD superfamily